MPEYYYYDAGKQIHLWQDTDDDDKETYDAVWGGPWDDEEETLDNDEDSGNIVLVGARLA